MKPVTPENPQGSRLAIIMNGSPLFTGDAGSGESEIRRYVLENDLVEGIVAMPNDLFYNTGIATYIWILTNNKSANRKGKVQLVNAVDFSRKMKKAWEVSGTRFLKSKLMRLSVCMVTLKKVSMSKSSIMKTLVITRLQSNARFV